MKKLWKYTKKIFRYIVVFLLMTYIGKKYIHWRKNKKILKNLHDEEIENEIKRNKNQVRKYKKDIKKQYDEIEQIKNKYSRIVK